MLLTREQSFLNLLSAKPGFFISDHCFINANFNFEKPAFETKTITFRKLKDIEDESFRADLLSSDFCTTNFDDVSVDEMVDLYNVSLISVLDKHAPLLSKNIVIKPKSPWYTGELHNIKKEKRMLESKWLKSKSIK